MTRDELIEAMARVWWDSEEKIFEPFDRRPFANAAPERRARYLRRAEAQFETVLLPLLKRAGESLEPFAKVAEEARTKPSARDREEFCASVSWGYSTHRTASAVHSDIRGMIGLGALPGQEQPPQSGPGAVAPATFKQVTP